MSDAPRRPILKLKFDVPLPRPHPVPPPQQWKCKPCGTAFVPAEAAAEGTVRCPKCNARLGLLADFLSETPPEKLRARPMNRT